MIKKLTAEQEIELKRWLDEGINIGTSTERADRPAAEAAITELYGLLKQRPPEFRWFASPLAAAQEIERITGENVRTTQCFWGQNDYWWQAIYAFSRDVLGVKFEDDDNRQLDLWVTISKSAGWWWPYENIVFCAERPTEIHWFSETESPKRLHNLNGFAVRFADDTGLCAIRGTRVPPDIIFNPESITAARITGERNAEVRRVMLDKYTPARYLQDIKATVLDSDTDPLGQPRELLQAQLPGDEPLTMLKVINSTPEPDGTLKVYMLRVDPGCRTVAEALGWTVGFDKRKKYAPELET